MDKSKDLDIRDKDLLDRYARTGDNHWLGLLLGHYTVLLFGFCVKQLKNIEEAKDAVQQVQLKVIQQVGRYPIENFHSWIYKIAVNECNMLFRKRRRLLRELTETDAQLLSEEGNAPDPQETFQLHRLTGALSVLKSAQQTCIRKFYLENKTYQDVAEETGYSLKEVKSHIQNGKRNLKLILEKKDENA